LERRGIHVLSDAFLVGSKIRRDFRSVWLQANNASNESNQSMHSKRCSQLCGLLCREAKCDTSLQASSIHFAAQMSHLKALEFRAAALLFTVF
jgi:hypothetical protein